MIELYGFLALGVFYCFLILVLYLFTTHEKDDDDHHPPCLL